MGRKVIQALSKITTNQWVGVVFYTAVIFWLSGFATALLLK